MGCSDTSGDSLPYIVVIKRSVLDNDWRPGGTALGHGQWIVLVAHKCAVGDGARALAGLEHGPVVSGEAAGVELERVHLYQPQV